MNGIACSANVAWSAMTRNLAAALPQVVPGAGQETAEGGRWHTVRRRGAGR